MSEYITDPELLRQLGEPGESTAETGYITDPELLKQLGEPMKPIDSPSMVAPAFYPRGPLGVNTGALKEIGMPMVTAGKEAYNKLSTSTPRAIIDVGAMAVGLPPPTTTIEAAKGAWTVGKAGIDSYSTFNRIMDAVEPLDKARIGLALQDMMPLLDDADANKIAQTITKSGPKEAFAELASTTKNQQVKQMAKQVMGYFPTGTEKAVALAKPFVKAAGKVLGPIGIGMDLYSAGQMARDTKLGERLQVGEGKKAEQAFRGMNVPYGPQAMTAEQIEYLRANASPRDLKAFGL